MHPAHLHKGKRTSHVTLHLDDEHQRLARVTHAAQHKDLALDQPASATEHGAAERCAVWRGSLLHSAVRSLLPRDVKYRVVV